MPSHWSTPGSSAHRRSPHSSVGLLGPLDDQVGADPRQHGAAPASQLRRRVGVQALTQGGDHRGRDRWRRQLELFGDHRRPVGVQATGAHRVVQGASPVSVSDPAGPSATTAPRTAPAARRAPRTPPAPRTRWPAHPAPRAPARDASRPRCRPRAARARSRPARRSPRPAPRRQVHHRALAASTCAHCATAPRTADARGADPRPASRRQHRQQLTGGGLPPGRPSVAVTGAFGLSPGSSRRFPYAQGRGGIPEPERSAGEVTSAAVRKGLRRC